MNSEELQRIMDLLHQVTLILKESNCEVWNETWFEHIEATQQQMLSQYEWEQN